MSFQTKLDLSQQSRIPTGQTADWKGSVNIGETLRIGGFEINPRSPFLGSTLLFDGFTQSYKSGNIRGNGDISTSYDGNDLVISLNSGATIGPRLRSINDLSTYGIMVNYGTDVSTVSLTGSTDFVISNPSGISGSSIEFSLSNTGVGAGVYGSSTVIPSFTVDNKGRIVGVTGTTVNIVSALSGLTDVSLSSPINNNILGYNGTSWYNTTVDNILGYTPVSPTRTLTINGESYDLTANRTWTVDTMTKICPNIVTLSGSPYYTASYGDSVYVDTDLVADNCFVILPTIDIYGGLVYVKNMAQPSTYTVSVSSYVLQNGEWLLLRKGKFGAWEVIASSLTDTPSNSNTNHAITSGGVFNSLGGYIPLTGTSTSGKITGDLVTADVTTVKFGRPAGSGVAWFEVRGGGGSSNIGMFAEGTSLGFRGGFEALFNGANRIDSQTLNIESRGSNILTSVDNTNILSSTGSVNITSSTSAIVLNANSIAINAKDFNFPARINSLAGTSNGLVGYDTFTNKFEGRRGGFWKNFLMEGDLVAYSGTTNRITITTGYTIDIASNYSGQTTINTVGSIITGSWSGTPIMDAYIASAATWNAKFGVGGGTLTGALNEAPAVVLASSATTNIGSANSNNIVITGTTTISSFGTVAEGVVRMIRFSGTLTLTHNATTLQLPNGTNITTQDRDTAIFRSLGSGNWICISYKSITALTNKYIPYFDGTRWRDSIFYQNNGGLECSVSSIPTNGYLINANVFNAGGTARIVASNDVNTAGGIGVSGTLLSTTFFRNKATFFSTKSMIIATDTNDVNSGNSNVEFQLGGYLEPVCATMTKTSFALGSSVANASAQLDLQSNSKGLGLNLIPGDLGTSRNGLIWYDTLNNLFKGTQNGVTVTFSTQPRILIQDLVMYNYAMTQQIGCLNAGTITSIQNVAGQLTYITYRKWTQSSGTWGTLVTPTFTSNIATVSIPMAVGDALEFNAILVGANLQGTLTLNTNLN